MMLAGIMLSDGPLGSWRFRCLTQTRLTSPAAAAGVSDSCQSSSSKLLCARRSLRRQAN